MVLLYGSKSLVITGKIMNASEAFHHRIIMRITGKKAQHVGDEGWECTL